jgi:hypothetical protein
MNPRSSLDSRLLGLITIAFSLVCASALWIELAQTPEAHWAAAQA